MTARDVRGSQIAYDDTGGAGVPLVLVHGFPLERTIWAGQMRGLRGVARVIAPDLRGFGETPPSAAPVTVDTYARDVGDLLDSLGLASAVIGGVSMGGYVALAFHRLFPVRVRGLVLVDTRAGGDSPDARRARDASAVLAREKGAVAIAARMLPKMLTPASAMSRPELVKSLDALMSRQSADGIVAALAAMRDRPDSTSHLARIAVPTLIVSGAEDALIPPREAESMHAAVAGSRLALIPRAAHLPNYEQPEKFDAVVREWMTAVP